MPTRISGACNGCRAKKQKCSGDRSGCSQCAVAGITCTWPEQRKRGPAKGYIEGLEHRLHDAESLLLHLLPHVSQEQLQSATSDLSHAQGPEYDRLSPDQRSSPPPLNKKTGIDYWETFPLDNVENIRRWQQDCEIHVRSDTTTTINALPSNLRSDRRRSSPSHSSSRRANTDHNDLHQELGQRAAANMSRHNRHSSFPRPTHSDNAQMQAEPLQMLNSAAQQVELNDGLEGWMASNDYSQLPSRTSAGSAGREELTFQDFPNDPAAWPPSQATGMADIDMAAVITKPDLSLSNAQQHLFW